MFIDGTAHRHAEQDPRKAKWSHYEWTRASDLFAGEPFYVHKVIEPEDVKQGNLDNAQVMACLSGMAATDVSKHRQLTE